MTRFARWIAAAAAATLLGLVPSSARAQYAPFERSFETNLLEPAMGLSQGFMLETARVPKHLGWGAGAFLGYQNSSMSVYLVDDQDNLEESYPLVGSHITAYLYGFLGVINRLQLSLGLPIYWQNQLSGWDRLTDDLVAAGALPPDQQSSIDGVVVGDLRVHVKGYIYGIQNKMHNLAASLTIKLPIWHWAGGDEADKFMGERNVVLWPRFIYELRFRGLSASVNVGFLARVQKTTFLSTEARHELTYGVGGFYKVATFGDWHLDVLAELNGRTGLTNELDANPLEIDAGVRFGMAAGLSLWLGAGAGLIKAVGSPTFRVFLGVQFAPDFSDADGDGVPDFRDKCPKQKEDKDGFEDRDGCPDADNDKDGVPDLKDKCPDKAEDFDRYKDADGCPDLDNDGDGVPDKRDNCPLNKGPAKTKGCPANMLDEDGDGIPDNKDKCPAKAEDKDGFQDADGCPDLDNDGDGIPDEHDKCKNDPEDKDGFQDADGCADPDDDGDGVCDDNPTIQKNIKRYRHICHGADKCPKQMEEINGVDDLDGCKDSGKAAVRLSLKAGPGYKGRFILASRFKFADKYGATLSESNKAVLRQLAHILRMAAARKAIRQVAIMAFTDRTRSNDQAIAVTKAQAEAIVRFLVSLGTKRSRLVAVPAGNTNPVCSKRYRSRRRRRRCNRKNRRVSFFIIKMGS